MVDLPQCDWHCEALSVWNAPLLILQTTDKFALNQDRTSAFDSQAFQTRPSAIGQDRPKAGTSGQNKSLALGTFRDHPKLGFTRGDIGSTSVCQCDILDDFTAIQSQARAASDAVAMARGVDAGPVPEER